MKPFRYIFEKGSKKHHCPSCHKKRFVRYIDIEKEEYLPEQYGRCDREINCGYHLNPYDDNYNKSENFHKPIAAFTTQKKPKQKRIYFPKDVFVKTRKGYDKNTFIQNLVSNIDYPFDVVDIEKVIAQYHIGTISKGYRLGATTFPFIDSKANVRTIQVKQFDTDNHTTGTDFLHSIIEKDYKFKNKELPKWLDAYNKNDTKVSCLFGEHLLQQHQNNPIALVEAPKTAIYGTLYFGFPEQPKNLLWLAVYNLSSLNLKKCKALKGRKVYLFPDLSKDGKAYQLWYDKAKEIQRHLPGTFFKVSDFLEQYAPIEDRIKGKDIADYLIKLDWRKFRTIKKKIKVELEEPKHEIKEEIKESPQIDYVQKIDNFQDDLEDAIIEKETLDWSKDIQDLEQYFENTTLPTNPVKLNQCSTILDCNKFVESHLKTVKANNANPTFQPYLDRLLQLKLILETNLKA